jgi:hypothetical protein
LAFISLIVGIAAVLAFVPAPFFEGFTFAEGFAFIAFEGFAFSLSRLTGALDALGGAFDLVVGIDLVVGRPASLLNRCEELNSSVK